MSVKQQADRLVERHREYAYDSSCQRHLLEENATQSSIVTVEEVIASLKAVIIWPHSPKEDAQMDLYRSILKELKSRL